jgi:alpha-1,3-mannosyltransferase
VIKVCHLVRQYAPNIGGLESFVAHLARALVADGCACDILTLDRLFMEPKQRLAAQEIIADLSVRRVPFVGQRRLFVPIIHRALLEPYDVLHVHGVDGLFERVAREPIRAGQVRIATSHGLIFHTPQFAHLKQIYLGSITSLAARSYDCLIANSTSDAHLMARMGPRRIELIQNGVEKPVDAIGQGRDLLYLGRLASHKHIEKLVAMMAQPELVDAHLHIVGADWDVRRSELADIAHDLDAAQRVTFHGRLDGRELAEVVQCCGVFVSASAYEGFGMSLVEAMSMGLIPVTHPNASFRELLNAAPIGALVSFDDAVASARAVAYELRGLSPERRQAAIAFAERFSWSRHAARTIALYEDLLHAQARDRAA